MCIIVKWKVFTTGLHGKTHITFIFQKFVIKKIMLEECPSVMVTATSKPMFSTFFITSVHGVQFICIDVYNQGHGNDVAIFASN